MRLLLGVIATLFISVWMALSLRQDPGYAMFSLGQWTIETSLAFFVIVLVISFLAFYPAGPAERSGCGKRRVRPCMPTSGG